MSKCVKVTTDNQISIIDLDLDDYQAIISELDCFIFEVVKTQLMESFFHRDVVMLVDESGFARGLSWNCAASVLYGYRIHGNPIVGDVIFCLRNGPDLAGFDNVEVDVIYSTLLSSFRSLKEG